MPNANAIDANPLRIALGIFVACLAIYIPTASTTSTISDAAGAELLSWRVATSGQPWFEGVDMTRAPISEANQALFSRVPDSRGHLVVTRSPGVAVMSIPAYWLAAPSADVADFSFRPGAYSAAFVAAATVSILFLALVQLLRRGPALVATAAFALATPIWSVAATTPHTHTVTTLGIVGMAAAASRERWWLVGVMGGVVGWGRIHALVIVAVVGLMVGVSRRDVRPTAIIGGISALVMSLASLWTYWVYGRWIPSGGYDPAGYVERTANDSTLASSVASHLGIWVSPDRGFFIWTPIALLLIPALVRSWTELPDWARALPIGGLIYTSIQAQFGDFAGGDTFYGYRHGLELLACATPALAIAAHRAGRFARPLVAPVLGVQFTAILVGATTGGYLLRVDEVWQDNSFLAAVRLNPALLVIAALIALVFALATKIHSRSPNKPEAVRAGH